MVPMKIYHALLAASPFPFFGFVIALISLQHDRAALLAKHLPTTAVEASIASAGIGAVISFMAAVLIAAVIAVSLGRFDDRGTDDTPEFGLAA